MTGHPGKRGKERERENTERARSGGTSHRDTVAGKWKGVCDEAETAHPESLTDRARLFSSHDNLTLMPQAFVSFSTDGISLWRIGAARRYTVKHARERELVTKDICDFT